MALIHTLMRLKEDGLVESFDMNGEKFAAIHLTNGDIIHAFMFDDYIVGITAIREAASHHPRPDYIVYNAWDKVTQAARRHARDMGIPLVSYWQFRDAIG